MTDGPPIGAEKPWVSIGGPSVMKRRLSRDNWTPSEIEQYSFARSRGHFHNERSNKTEGLLTAHSSPQVDTTGGLRKTTRQFSSDPLSHRELSEWIARSLGCVSCRPYALAGGVSGLVCTVLSSEAGSEAEGLFAYSGEGHRLERVLNTSFDRLLETVDLDQVKNVQAIIMLSVDLTSRRGYKNAYDLGLIEVGQALQSLELNAAQTRIGLCPLGAVYPEAYWDLPWKDSPLRRAEAPLLAIACGYKTTLNG